MMSRGQLCRGAAARRLLVAIALVAALLLVLWRVLASAPEASAPDSDLSGVNTSPRDVGAELDAPIDAEKTALQGDSDRGVRAGAVPVGVRLRGPGKLEGHVIERATALGIAGVRVDLLPVPPAGASFIGRMLRMSGLSPEMSERVRPIAVAETGAGGRFSFVGVRQGTYYIDARGPYHAPETAVRARVLSSGSGGPIDVFVFGGGRVLGRVLAPDSVPAKGAKLALVDGPRSFIKSASTGDVRLAETLSDEDGAFEYPGVVPGNGYEITVVGQGFAISHLVDIEVKAGEDTHVIVRTRIGGTIVGRVVSQEVIADKTETSSLDAKPLAQAHLGAVPRGLRDLRFAEELLEETHCISGEDGSFVMHNVPPGEVDLIAIAPGHLPAIGAHVAVADGATVQAPDIALGRGPMVAGRVVDGSGAPISGVQVRWNMIDWRNFQFDFSFAPMMAQGVKGFDFPLTDADGRFVAGPCAGKPEFKIDFMKTGYEDANFKYDPSRDGAEITITMHRGSAVEGVVMDAMAAEPVKSFTISGSDRVDVEGTAPGSRNPFSGGQLFEDANGRFRLESVKPGDAKLTFTAPGYLDQTVENITVVEGQATKGIIVKMKPGGVVRGIVDDGAGHPVAGAQVVAVPASGKIANAPINDLRNRRGDRNRMRLPFMGGGDLPPAMMNYAASLGLLGDKVVLTNAKGEFELTSVEPGSLHVQAFHRDYLSASSDVLTLGENAPLEGVRVSLSRGGGIHGKVNDRHGRPVTGSIVVAMSPQAFGGEGNTSAGGLYQGESGPQGEYTIKHVAAGSYFLVATRGDEALNPMSFFGNLNFDVVTVPAGEMVEFDLVDSSAGGCRVFGTVTCQGQPISHASLTAISFESESMLGVEFKAARVGEGGQYEFPGLAPGEYQLNLDGAGPHVVMKMEVPDAAEMRVDLACPEGGLEGVVVDDATNEPIEKADVALRALDQAEPSGGFLAQAFSREGRAQHHSTDEKGRFTFERQRGAEYELVARPRGDAKQKYASSEPRTVRIDENRVERGVEVRLLPALSLSGVVKDTRGDLVKGASVLVSLQDVKDSPFEHASTDENGHFTVTSLAPGVYVATASKDDYADGIARDIQVERSTKPPHEISIQLEKGVKVTVRVFGPDGRPASGARADLVRLKGDPKLQAANVGRMMTSLFSGEGASDADGRVDLGRFAPGEYKLEVQRGFSKVTVPDVKIKSGEDEVELRADLQ